MNKYLILVPPFFLLNGPNGPYLILFARIFFHPGTRQEKKESHCPDLIRLLFPKSFTTSFRSRGKILSRTAERAFCPMVKAVP
jgi:hypothetical protein